ncbi:MAG TPA: hypothetical protein VK213_00830 [Bacteroidales bacterium]|nr:hypothetical protein [Bacteroidales bacterium]
METRDIIILIVVAVYVSVRLYMRYGKKKTETKSSDKDTIISSSTDYEPYSGDNT